MITAETLSKITGTSPNDNMRSFLEGLNGFGAKIGLDTSQRIAQYIPQMAHESARFVHDRELWGPTAAQRRYEGRTDIGNTESGDGYRFRGRGPIQITGRYNYGEFTDWARELDPTAPDFVENPDLINTDPWEGLTPIWFWDTRNLNKYADQGDNEMVTRKINGGLNGYQDRLELYDRTALVMLGYAPDNIRGFQDAHGLLVDGISGPKTRSEMHKALGTVPLVKQPKELSEAEQKLKLIRKVLES